MESVKRPNIWHQTGTLFLEDFPDCLIAHLGMFVCLSVGDAAILKPSIQLGIGFELWPRHKEPATDHTHLVLNLTLLPARGRSTGDRIDQIVTAHLLETPVIGAVFPDEDRVYRRLHIIVDATRAGPTEECKRFVRCPAVHCVAMSREGCASKTISWVSRG